MKCGVSKYSFELNYNSMSMMFTDSIEANVESASVHVEQGNQQLHQAKNYQVKQALPVPLTQVSGLTY